MSDLPLQAGCCCVDQAKGMTSSSVDLPLLLPSPPLLQPCTTQGINKHTTGSIQQLAAYLYKEKQKHTHRNSQWTLTLLNASLVISSVDQF